MPCRLVREGILSSERVNMLSCEAEVFYRRLMSVADDYGRFSANPALLRAALYPLRLETVSEAGIDHLLADVERARLVRLYEVAGKRYLEILDFRQQLRSKQSKYPDPPGTRDEAEEVDAQQMLSTCTATAHLGGGGGEVVSVSGGEGGAGAKERPGAAPPLHVQIALALRGQGVSISSAHPKALAWAKQGVSVAQALEAASIARLRKPQGSIAPNYLAPIIEEILNPRPAAGRDPTWWTSEPATLSKGRELGLNPSPGEAMGDYRARINAAIEKGRGEKNGGERQQCAA